MKYLWIPLLALLPCHAAQTLTYSNLANRLTNLSELAVMPVEGEACKQWSSYDRKSVYDPMRGAYVDWEANGDGHGIIRKEGTQEVLAEIQGPGCIWRIWSATPKQGRVRIFLDGQTEPAVDLPFVGYFDGKNEPFTRSALVHTVARGWNNYTPIPFQKSCRVVADPGWGDYYQFVYSTFPAGTHLPTFSRELVETDSQALDGVNHFLSNAGPLKATGQKGLKKDDKHIRIQPGETVTVTRLRGPSAVVSLMAQVETARDQGDIEALRELALRITWDKAEQPAVWSPLGDFFGTAPGLNPYRSLPLGVTEDGWLYSNWYMPFDTEAHVELINEGKTQRSVRFEIAQAPLSKPISQLGRFHAKWHRDMFMPSDRGIDWTMLTTTGRGRFAGVMLHIWNPRGGWWGEGDEKFFVDGETFPSTIGTGSEDYFGYAWCDPGLFQNAFHNQTRNDGNNRGHVSVNRWHIADNIPFTRSFGGYIEKYYPNSRPTLYSAVAYWYLQPGGIDPYPEIGVDERLGYWHEVQVRRIPGALEGEKLKVISKTAGNPHEQDVSMFGNEWSGEAHLWWVEAKPGDKLEVGFPVTTSGKYRLTAQLTQARDYAIVQLGVNGQAAGDPIDLHNPEVRLAKLINLGTFQLKQGQNVLNVQIVGANAAATKSYMFGLDYLKLEPVQ